MGEGSASLGLGRAGRLRSSKDFRRVNRQGRRQASPHFVALLAPGREPHTRLGLAVSRRVGNAVARNRVKRRLREWFRCSRDSLPEGRDLVVIARRGAAELSSAHFVGELVGLQERLKC